MKRVVTIQDISCLGKCSLTVALPIISVFGVETCVIPTAVLSTHTMFKNFTFRDLTCDMRPILKHWQDEKFEFNAIYTGYLGSYEQINLVKEYFTALKNDNCVTVVDPVMADNGKLYPGFTIDFAKEMATLCAISDYIVPNLTEACIMLDKEYIEKGYSREYIEDILISLANLGAKTAILTGVSFEDGKTGVMGYDTKTKEFFEYYHNRIDASYHGTGDIFSSTFVGALTKGKNVLDALKIACDYTAKCVEITVNNPNSVKYGVEFENAIPYLVKKLENE
ncbi:MAG: pyridoxamine kinase [Clostridia bacterium]|nr:pyridoxamine kinase [Clostridia bacterium]